MTISKKLGIGYAIMATVCLILVAWLGYHEFIEEAETFASHGVSDLHQDTAAEFSTVCFLGAVPLLLAFGWWWTRRVLAPLAALTDAAEQIQSDNLRLPLPRSMNDDEVDTLAGVFDSMTARLDESFRQIREFTLHASHELKTPLTVMRAQLETLLRENAPLPSGQSEWIESLLDEVQRLTTIVDSLTLLTKADAGAITLERKSVSLSEIVQEAAEDAIYLAQTHDVQVTLEGCDEVVVTGDRHRLRQLLLILTDNAVKYNHPDGSITISLRSNAGNAEMRVSNTGEPLGPEQGKRLFERFVRGENAKGKVEGCGLGLTIARWIVQAHGGGIELSTDADGQTMVLVRIPIAAAVPRTATKALAAV